MKGTRAYLFLLSVLLTVYGLALLGKPIRPTCEWMSWLPSTSQLPFLGRSAASADRPQPADSVLQLADAAESLQAAIELSASAPKPPTKGNAQSTATTAEAIRTVKSPSIQYTEDGEAQLGKFFAHLQAIATNGRALRILHFGDSQVEGDRITSYIRSRLQGSFGGKGVGLVSAVPPVSPPFGLSVKHSSGWESYSMMPATHRKPELAYGPMGSLCRFSQQVYESTDSAHYVGTIDIRRKLKSGNGMRFTQCRVLLRTHGADCLVQLVQRDSTVWNGTAPQSTIMQQVKVPLPDGLEHFALRFEAKEPVDILGISYETPAGIQVDNLPLRGSSGTDFTAINDTTFAAIRSLLAPRLVILQFGVNMVPSRLNSYTFYRDMLKKQIRRLRALLPHCAFIIIGVSDMAEKEGETFRTYPNVQLVRNAQRSAALESGIAFWDCYEAMGGENAIVSWVNATPPMATSDYVHFTPRGARYVGELFYSALMEAYQAYTKRSQRATADTARKQNE